MKGVFIGALLCLSACPAQTVRARVGIDFGLVHLTLGMPKDQTIAVMSKAYSVSPWKEPGGDTWFVGSLEEPHILTGSLTFGGDHLVRASKTWENSNTAYSAIHVVANLLDRLHSEGFSHCSVASSKEAYAAEEQERDVISIDCGQKRIVISTDRGLRQGQEYQGVDIGEVIEYVAGIKNQ
jgi:hypothetical protein